MLLRLEITQDESDVALTTGDDMLLHMLNVLEIQLLCDLFSENISCVWSCLDFSVREDVLQPNFVDAEVEELVLKAAHHR